MWRLEVELRRSNSSLSDRRRGRDFSDEGGGVYKPISA